jgi:hypothetical protein
MGLVEKIVKLCGGINSYVSIKLGCKSDGEMTITIRTNYQEIANENNKQELFGYMLGKWLMKNTSVFFCNGLFKCLKEGMN